MEAVAAVLAAAGLGSVLTAVVQRWLTRRQDGAQAELLELEAESTSVGTAAQVVAMVRAQLTELSLETQACRAESASLRTEVVHLTAAVELLTSEVHRLGGDPAAVLAVRRKGLQQKRGL